MGGRVHEWVDGWVDGWMDGSKDLFVNFSIVSCSFSLQTNSNTLTNYYNENPLNSPHSSTRLFKSFKIHFKPTINPSSR